MRLRITRISTTFCFFRNKYDGILLVFSYKDAGGFSVFRDGRISRRIR